MGRHPPRRQHDALQVLVLDQHEVRERELVRDQHAVLGERALRLLDAEEVPQDAQPDVLHVDGPVAEIAVGHLRELPQVLLHDLLEGALGARPLPDRLLELVEESAILEHQAVRIDDGGVELGQPAGEPRLQALELDRGLLQRPPEAALLLLGRGPGRVLDQVEADRRLQEVRAPAAEAGGRGQAGESRAGTLARGALGALGPLLLVGLEALDRAHHPPAVVPALLLLALQVLEQPGLHDDTADLRGDGAQQAQLVRGELPPAERLHDEHADRGATLDDRHSDEGVVLLLPRLGEELVAGVHDGVDRHHRLELLDRHAGQPLIDAHRDLADRARGKPGGRPQGQPLGARIEDVEGADVGAGALRHHLDDALQRLLQVLGARGERADVLEDLEALGAAAAALGGALAALAGRLATLRFHRRARS